MSSYGLWLSAAGMQVNDHRQALLANNMANINTTGFKHDLAVVTQRQIESRALAGGQQFAHKVLDEISGGVNVRPSYHSFAQGAIEHTGRPLDVAIQGDGFLAVSDGAVTRYTRDGELARNRDGELVMVAGEGRWKVVSEGGSTILLAEEGGPVRISADGTVRQGNTVVDKLGIVSIEDKQSLRKVGENLFEDPLGMMEPIEGQLVSEARERSTFDPMHGLVSLIETSRAYELNASMVKLHDEMTGIAVSRVARVA
ncbi:MAG: flagellar hook basal-body protein [Phycisphaerales bacterium]|nr:MAG: flagellar hook basal-body protein [Phycisphaerales bacterium]